MTVKTPITLPAKPVTASRMLPRVPIPTEIHGLIFGKVVLKLFAAMNDEKHDEGKVAKARNAKQDVGGVFSHYFCEEIGSPKIGAVGG